MKRRFFATLSLLASFLFCLSGVSLACTAPQWVSGTTYATGDKVTNNNHEYTCLVGGWCSVANADWAYAPGTGSYSDQAWQDNGACGTQNVPPTAELTAPLAGSTYVVGQAITLQANAADTDGTVSKVVFYQGATVLGETTTSPYEFTVNNLAAGNYTFKAVAVDNLNATGESNTAAVTVKADALTVNITAPTNNAVIQPDTVVTIAASTSSTNEIVEVTFQVNGAVVATDTIAPYEATWAATALGSHLIEAIALDNTGKTASAAVTVQVKDAPIPTPFKERALVGYWETWHATIHSAGHIPLNDINDKYNVLNVAFPVILADGTALLEPDMAPGELPPTPAEIAQAKARGKKVILSIGGAAAGINLNSPAVVDRFITTCTAILKRDGYDGIDIDIESGLVSGPSMTQLSDSQKGLINLINGILSNFGPDFMLTMAPETAYVTGGGVAYGGPWGAYLPVINAVRDRLDWIQMQYYNGSMFGKDGASYDAGTVIGMVEQTKAMVDGFKIGDGSFFQGLPAEKVVVGLPAITGAGGGYMRPADVQSAFTTLQALYPNLRGLMTWSANWDASNGYEFANSHGPYLKGFGPVK